MRWKGKKFGLSGFCFFFIIIFFKMSRRADDAELDDLLDGLDDIQIGGGSSSSSSSSTKPVLPAHWNEPKPQAQHARRHDERDINNLLNKLDQQGRERMPVAVVPETAPVEISSAGRCSSCRKDVVDATFSKLGDGSVYHDQCFSCSNCGGRLQGAVDKDREGRLLCTRCVPLATCKRCGQHIQLTDKFVEQDGVTLHSNSKCLTCAKCRNPLQDEVFYTRGDLHCRNCF